MHTHFPDWLHMAWAWANLTNTNVECALTVTHTSPMTVTDDVCVKYYYVLLMSCLHRLPSKLTPRTFRFHLQNFETEAVGFHCN